MKKVENIYIQKTNSKKIIKTEVNDIVDKMSKILSEELAKSIDMDILRGLGYESNREKRRVNKINKIWKNVC
jgi:ribosome-binding factor A